MPTKVIIRDRDNPLETRELLVSETVEEVTAAVNEATRQRWRSSPGTSFVALTRQDDGKKFTIRGSDVEDIVQE